MSPIIVSNVFSDSDNVVMATTVGSVVNVPSTPKPIAKAYHVELGVTPSVSPHSSEVTSPAEVILCTASYTV